MKILKFGLRFWITLTSMVSFLTGWVMLANAPKPSQSNASASSVVAPFPTLEPMRPLSEFERGDDTFQDNQPLFDVQQRNQSRPFFTTGGS